MQLYNSIKEYVAGAYDSVKRAALPIAGLVALLGVGTPAKGGEFSAREYLDQQETRSVDLNAYRVASSQTEADKQREDFKFCTFGCFGCQGCQGCYGKITSAD